MPLVARLGLGQPLPQCGAIPACQVGGAYFHTVVSVTGWVFEGNLVRFLELVSGYTGYEYDDLDEIALLGAVERTDDELVESWFSYPLQGAPPLTIYLARAVGGSVVSVRVEGDIDPVLTARIETLFDLL
jgi:hypothetical protein